MKTITTKAKIILLSLLSLALISTTCKKRYNQTDLDNARKEGVAAAQPSADRLLLLKVQKDFTEKAKGVIYMADTINRNLLLQGGNIEEENYYSPAIAMAIFQKLEARTAGALVTAFGKPTNEDPAFISMTVTITQNAQSTKQQAVHTGLIFGFAKNLKLNPTIDDSKKSAVHRIGGHTFTFTATTPETPLFTINVPNTTTKNSKSTEEKKENKTTNPGDEISFYALTLSWEYNGKKEEVAQNLSTAPDILLAIQEALTRAIAVTR